MNINRKTFQYPYEFEVIEREIEINDGSFWNPKIIKKKIKDKRRLSYLEVVQKALSFANSLGPEQLVSVNEYTCCYVRLGDDQSTMFVIYWKEES